MTDRTPLWLFADQLGPHFRGGDLSDRPIVLIESAHALAHRRYHRQKLHLVLAGMRQLAADLGDRVTIVRAENYRAGLAEFGRPVVVHEPGSHAADHLVRRLHREGVVAEIRPTPGFTRSKADFAEWARDRRRLLMEDFYRDQRRRLGVLLEPDGEPVNGRWNLDHDNRRPPPTTADAGRPQTVAATGERHRRARRRRSGPMERDGTISTVGQDGPCRFAVSRAEARRALAKFLDGSLPTFGAYQDAMLGEDWSMSHAPLSVPLTSACSTRSTLPNRQPPAITAAAPHWPRSRASSGRSSAGVNGSGSCTGTSAGLPRPQQALLATGRRHGSSPNCERSILDVPLPGEGDTFGRWAALSCSRQA